MTPSLRRTLHYAITLLPPLALVTAVVLQPWFEARWAFMDPIIAGEISGDCCRIYHGFVSNVGVLYLAASGSVCLFAALCLRPVADAGKTGFLIGAGLLTAWLCLDDLFMIHEGVLPNLGVSQAVTIGIYGVLTAVYLVSSRREILSGEAPMLVIALACFAVSVGIDLVFHSVEGHLVWAEDAAKFIGIAAWTGFHVDAAFKLMAVRRWRALDERLGSHLAKALGELDETLQGVRRGHAGRTVPRRVPSAAIVGPAGRDSIAAGRRSFGPVRA